MAVPSGRREVLVTGCSSGIGEALAHGLAACGYRVFASARKRQDVERLAASGLEVLQLDLADPDSIARAMDSLLEQSDGSLYGLVNNGAYGQPGAVEDLPVSALRRQFETNFFGTHELSRRALQVFRAQGCGRLVQISSFLGYASMPFRGAYNASKYALEGLTDTLRQELHGSAIHAVLVEPGPIRSRFRENALAAFEANIPVAESHFRDLYEDHLQGRLRTRGDPPFTRDPVAVLRVVRKALEARRPRSRYRVTAPAHAFWWGQRLLPTCWMDAILRRVGGT
ncbi:MAG: SDR family NAD(P)-dependent oxidoreductase [Gammaproteobacteria bacterium]|nr:SDR family NAD(P)-dependent oxidoreductase [Gammaproteobacteria bacterium]